MKRVLASIAVLSLICVPVLARGQADSPAAVSNTMPTNNFGFNLPTHLGTLSYSLSGSEMVETGFSNGVETSTALSGNLAYISKSDRNPFSLVYSGGYLFTKVPGSSTSETFQDIAVSQVAHLRSWVFVASDAFSYLPNSPTTGLSGVAGVGDIGVYPVQTGVGPTQDILTTSGTRIGNGLQGSATWQMTPRVDLEGSASWQILQFVGSAPETALNTNSYTATFGPTYRIDARNSVGADVYYSRTTYPGYAGYLIETEGADLNYNRAWTRRLSTTISFGPETTHGTTFTAIPAQVNFAGSASANYATRTTGFYASYTRGVNSGSGVIFGALSDTVTFGMNRPLTRDWLIGANASYSRSVGLTPYLGVVPRYDSVFGGVQASRRLTDSLSAYASYTAVDQSYQNNSTGASAFSGLNHIFSVGITFAPAPLTSGR